MSNSTQRRRARDRIRRQHRPALIILAAVASMMIVYSPHPTIGLLVVAVVLGTETRTAVRQLASLRADLSGLATK